MISPFKEKENGGEHENDSGVNSTEYFLKDIYQAVET